MNQHTNAVSARTTSGWITALLTDMPKLDTARRLTVKHLKMTKDREICSQYPDLKTDNTSAHLSTIRRELVKSVIRIKDLPLYMHYKSFSLNITYFFLTANRPRCTLYLTLEKREQVSCPEHETSIINQWSLGGRPAVYYLTECGLLRITSDPLTAHCLLCSRLQTYTFKTCPDWTPLPSSQQRGKSLYVCPSLASSSILTTIFRIYFRPGGWAAK